MECSLFDLLRKEESICKEFYDYCFGNGIIIKDLVGQLDLTKIIPFILKHLFRDYEITSKEKSNINGYPDFELSKGEDKLYVELKNNDDSIRKSQIEWIIRNKDKNRYILWLEKLKYE